MVRSILLLATFLLAGKAHALQEKAELYAETFDAHWQVLADDYPYFALYGVDWQAEKEFHRPRALAAQDDTEFAWELARLIMALPDPHVAFIPAPTTIAGKWSVPMVKTKMVERRVFITSWMEAEAATPPESLKEDPFAYPEIIAVAGEPVAGVVEILAAGPVDSACEVRLRWPDGTEVDHTLQRPSEPNLPPEPGHYGEDWLVVGKVGGIGYLRIRSFDPDKATLGPDGKMTTMLRAALKELADTDGLILDLQGNGGGLVAASDPFLGHLLDKTRRYDWGNSGGKTRIIRARSPRYRKPVVAIVDAGSASGGEWAARILRDAGRAVVIGGRTAGAEAAVHTSTGPDGSIVHYSAWPMVEEGVTPFQEKGIEVDHFLPLTVEAMYRHGYEEARTRVEHARYAKALAVLKAPAEHLEGLLTLAAQGRP